MGQRLLAACDGVLKIIDRMVLVLVTLACIALVFLTFEQVLARYFFESSSVWVQELQWHLFSLVFLFGMSSALVNDQHVRVDIFYGRMSDTSKDLLNRLGLILFVIPSCGILTYYGFQFVSQSLNFQNPRPGDFYSSTILGLDHWLYSHVAGVETFVRSNLLRGEVSPDPGGLEARYLVKALIPVGAILLAIQALGLAVLPRSSIQQSGRT
ncbi:MAG: TRAP transporter small permease subunit [Pseudobacteriovorax sp.]|nr:TRAP transporter small permease subunit [Pseudobacteriovorax sp.]